MGAEGEQRQTSLLLVGILQARGVWPGLRLPKEKEERRTTFGELPGLEWAAVRLWLPRETGIPFWAGKVAFFSAEKLAVPFAFLHFGENPIPDGGLSVLLAEEPFLLPYPASPEVFGALSS